LELTGDAMRISLVLVVSAAALAACVSGTQMQAECEGKFTRFAEIVRCTQQNVAARNSSILSDPRAKLYLLKGEELASYVEAGTMSDIQAKVAWQQVYVQLRSAK